MHRMARERLQMRDVVSRLRCLCLPNESAPKVSSPGILRDISSPRLNRPKAPPTGAFGHESGDPYTGRSEGNEKP